MTKWQAMHAKTRGVSKKVPLHSYSIILETGAKCSREIYNRDNREIYFANCNVDSKN